jgi:hypothetical protein
MQLLVGVQVASGDNIRMTGILAGTGEDAVGCGGGIRGRAGEISVASYDLPFTTDRRPLALNGTVDAARRKLWVRLN